MRFIFFICILLSPHFLVGQVVNTERLRLNNTKDGFSGDIDFQMGLLRNRAGEKLQIGGRFNAEWIKKNHRLLLFTSFNYGALRPMNSNSEVTTFGNRQFAHLRFNKEVHKKLTWEVFIQNQRDLVQEIEWRFLSGMGPRFRILETDSFKLFLGVLYMYEYEKSNELLINNAFEYVERIIRKDHRMSNYLSIAVALTDHLALHHVTYFQPLLNNINDFRVATETIFRYRITKNISMSTSFQLVYDAVPPAGVPRTVFSMNNGLDFAF